MIYCREIPSTSFQTAEETAQSGAFFHTDQHGQPDIDVSESGSMEGGRRARGAGDGDEKEGAGGGAFFHGDQHGQSGSYFEGSKSG